MIKETKVLKESVVYHKYCDECGKEIPIGLVCSKASCEYCGKDLCDKCIRHEDDTFGDYRTVWCKSCWELGNEYRPKIEELENEIHRLYEEWKNKCKNNKQ
jgi:hypothetical protein